MLVEVTADFNKDISKLHDKKLLLAVKAALQRIETARNLSDIPNLKKMQGTSNYFRLRINDYRIGIFVNNDKITIARFLHRKEIYRYFLSLPRYNKSGLRLPKPTKFNHYLPGIKLQL